MNSELLLTGLIFALNLVLILMLFSYLFGRQPAISKRLLSPGTIPQRNRLRRNLTDLLQWHLRRLRASGIKRASALKLQSRLTHAGFRGMQSVAVFQLLRLAITLCGSLIGLLFAWWYGSNLLLSALSGCLVGYVAPRFVISSMGRRRRRRLMRELPDILSLMVVSLEAGIGIAEVVGLVGRETQQQGRLLGAELSAAAAQMRTGRSLEESLSDLAARTGIDDIKSVCALLIQSQKVGARLAPALRASAEMLTSRRRMAAEEAAHKASVKIMIPLVLLILPALFMIVLGPAVIHIKQTFGK